VRSYDGHGYYINIGKCGGKRMMPENNGHPPRIKIAGEPMPFIVICPNCKKPSHPPDFDIDDPPKGFICCYCNTKHRWKFNKNTHKWEIIPGVEKNDATSGDWQNKTGTQDR